MASAAVTSVARLPHSGETEKYQSKNLWWAHTQMNTEIYIMLSS